MADQVPRRILVVEDHAPLLGLIAKSLQHEGYVVITARTAEQALMALADLLPDLIVSDVMMPGIGGYALVEEIRTNPRTDLIPIVFLTARDTRKDRIRGLQAGVDAYLTKPFEPEELVAVIENILTRVTRTHCRVSRLPRAASSSADTRVLEDTDASAAPIKAGDGPAVQPRRGSQSAPSDLTNSEQRIAGLVAQGLSNKDIASRLAVSYRTVEMHLSNILAKKHLSNRVELALLVAREVATDAETM